MSVNKCTILGNLGRDPEIRTTQSGMKIANLSVATVERWKDRDGNRQEKTEWHRVVIFGALAEVAEKYLRKGSKVYIEGKLQTRKWEDKTGQARYSTEVVIQGYGGVLEMLDGKPQGSQAAQQSSFDDDSDIPF